MYLKIITLNKPIRIHPSAEPALLDAAFINPLFCSDEELYHYFARLSDRAIAVLLLNYGASNSAAVLNRIGDPSKRAKVKEILKEIKKEKVMVPLELQGSSIKYKINKHFFDPAVFKSAAQYLEELFPELKNKQLRPIKYHSFYEWMKYYNKATKVSKNIAILSSLALVLPSTNNSLLLTMVVVNLGVFLHLKVTNYILKFHSARMNPFTKTITHFHHGLSSLDLSTSIIHETVHWLGTHKKVVKPGPSRYLATALSKYYKYSENLAEFQKDEAIKYNETIIETGKYLFGSLKIKAGATAHAKDRHIKSINRLIDEKALLGKQEEYETGYFVLGILIAMKEAKVSAERINLFISYLGQGKTLEDSLSSIHK